MARMSGRIRKWMDRGQQGQALAECAMILLFVAVACVAVFSLLGGSIAGLYNGFNGSF